MTTARRSFLGFVLAAPVAMREALQLRLSPLRRLAPRPPRTFSGASAVVMFNGKPMVPISEITFLVVGPPVNPIMGDRFEGKVWTGVDWVRVDWLRDGTE